MHGTFDFVLFLLGALSYIHPSRAAQYDTLSIIFAIGLTVGGLITAVYMFNSMLKDFESTMVGQLMNAHGGGGMGMGMGGYIHEQLAGEDCDDGGDSTTNTTNTTNITSGYDTQTNPLNSDGQHLSHTNTPNANTKPPTTSNTNGNRHTYEQL